MLIKLHLRQQLAAWLRLTPALRIPPAHRFVSGGVVFIQGVAPLCLQKSGEDSGPGPPSLMSRFNFTLEATSFLLGEKWERENVIPGTGDVRQDELFWVNDIRMASKPPVLYVREKPGCAGRCPSPGHILGGESASCSFLSPAQTPVK